MSIFWTDQDQPKMNDPVRHVHQCADGCGAFYVCALHDGCSEKWVCPRCEAERVDHYWQLEFERMQAQQLDDDFGTQRRRHAK